MVRIGQLPGHIQGRPLAMKRTWSRNNSLGMLLEDCMLMCRISRPMCMSSRDSGDCKEEQSAHSNAVV